METNENMDGAMGFDELPLEKQLEVMAIKRRLMKMESGDTKRFLDRSFHRRDVLKIMRWLPDRNALMRLLVLGAEDADKFNAEKPDVIYEEWAYEFDMLRHLLQEMGIPCMRAGVRAVMAAMDYEFDRALLIAKKSQVGEENIIPVIDFYKRNM